MRLNSDQSIRQALEVHERFGTWEAVREAASSRSERIASEIRDQPRSAPDRRTLRRS